MTLSMLAVVACALAVGNDAAQQQKMTPSKQKLKMNSVTAAVGHITGHGDVSVQKMTPSKQKLKMNSVTAAVGHIAGHGDVSVHGESAQRLVRRAPKPAELFVRSVKKAKTPCQECCQAWSETHEAAHLNHEAGHTPHLAHNLHTSHNKGCPEGFTRNLEADNDPVPEDANGVAINEAQAVEDCCEEMSKCPHFWNFHHEYALSDHLLNHGCPSGMTKRDDAEDDDIDDALSHDEIVEICCEYDTCQTYWDHHGNYTHGHVSSVHRGNHGCPFGETMKQQNEHEPLDGKEHHEVVELCCEDDGDQETCQDFWDHHSYRGHDNHGCPDGYERDAPGAGQYLITGETHEEQQEECCDPVDS